MPLEGAENGTPPTYHLTACFSGDHWSEIRSFLNSEPAAPLRSRTPLPHSMKKPRTMPRFFGT